MEALIIIGLSDTVVQFGKSAQEVWSESITARQSGGPKSVPALRGLVSHLTGQAGFLYTYINATRTRQEHPQETQNLVQLASECEETGLALLRYLDRVPKPLTGTIQNPQTNSPEADNLFKWSFDTIDKFYVSLNSLRGTWILATILAFRANTDSYSEAVIGQLKALISNSTAIDPSITDQVANIIQLLLDVVLSKSPHETHKLRQLIQDRLLELLDLRVVLPQQRENEILRWLDFRHMSWRYDEVPTAYQETYQWIFQRPPIINGWDDFAAYLETQDICGPYFIDGKAGSGKSTLMKFVLKHPQTKERLTRWATGSELLDINFFFWNLGTELQKSNVGMLRALIYKVLKEYPELVPTVFPNLYRDWKENDAKIEPSYFDLKRAFELVIEKSAHFLKLCIFIDGVDEFHGDHRDMSAFLRALASERIKLVISSRPIAACLNIFEGCPTLRLQNLTLNDMELFVHGTLASHQPMVRLMRHVPAEAEMFVSEIKTRAEGVFLWVKLVVHILMDGLEAGDDMEDLRKKLLTLPPDLRDLYRRMLGKVAPLHQAQAAEIFQLFYKWNSEIGDQPLRTIVLAFALDSPLKAFSRNVEQLDIDTFSWLCETTEAKLNGRCCGLVEVHRRLPSSITDGTSRMSFKDVRYVGLDEINSSHISYLHRTVAEFLVSDDVWNETCEMTKGSDFYPISRLASACLSMLKMEEKYLDEDVRVYVNNITKLCRIGNDFPDALLCAYMEGIDRTMHQLLQRQQHRGTSGSGEPTQQPPPGLEHWSNSFYPLRVTRATFNQQSLREQGSLLTLAVRTGVVRYLRVLGYFQVGHLLEYALILHALESWRDSSQIVCLSDRSDTLLFLLRNASAPEQFGPHGILWEHAVTIADLLQKGKPHECYELIRVFMVSTQEPKTLLLTPISYDGHVVLEPISLIHGLRINHDSEIRRLGDEFDQLAAIPTLAVAGNPLDSVSRASTVDMMSRHRHEDFGSRASFRIQDFRTNSRPISHFDSLPRRRNASSIQDAGISSSTATTGRWPVPQASVQPRGISTSAQPPPNISKLHEHSQDIHYHSCAPILADLAHLRTLDPVTTHTHGPYHGFHDAYQKPEKLPSDQSRLEQRFTADANGFGVPSKALYSARHSSPRPLPPSNLPSLPFGWTSRNEHR